LLLTTYFVLGIIELDHSLDEINSSRNVLVKLENTSSINISIEEGNINLYNIIFLFINRNILFLGVNEKLYE